MTWLPIVLLGLFGFLIGGSWSFYKQKRIGWAIALAVLGVASFAAAVLWAWEPQ